MATISKPTPSSRAARKKVRPMRPKPLIATRTVTEVLLVSALGGGRSIHRDLWSVMAKAYRALWCAVAYRLMLVIIIP